MGEISINRGITISFYVYFFGGALWFCLRQPQLNWGEFRGLAAADKGNFCGTAVWGNFMLLFSALFLGLWKPMKMKIHWSNSLGEIVTVICSSIKCEAWLTEELVDWGEFVEEQLTVKSRIITVCVFIFLIFHMLIVHHCDLSWGLPKDTVHWNDWWLTGPKIAEVKTVLKLQRRGTWVFPQRIFGVNRTVPSFFLNSSSWLDAFLLE